jgi:hypothetical protein
MHVLQTAFPGEEARYFLPMKIGGGDPTIADEGAAAVLDGIKTTTSSPFWDYPDGRIPFVGAAHGRPSGRQRYGQAWQGANAREAWLFRQDR